jgi:hypothetical protein
MTRILLVTDSASGVGVGNLQHRGTLLKSNGGPGDAFDTSSTRSVEVIAATIWRNLVRLQLRHNITVHATSGFLRCRNEKTATCTDTSGRREYLNRRAGQVRSDMNWMESGQLLRNATSRAPQSNRVLKQINPILEFFWKQTG